MPTQYLWVVKNSRSKRLSRSSRSEESQIRHHVQRQRLIAIQERRKTSTDEQLQRQSHEEIPGRFSLNLCYPDLTGSEKRGLNHFINRTAREWSGWQDSVFWNSLALQTCHQERSIAHGLIAIGAWHEYCGLPSQNANRAYLCQFALAQSVKAFAQGRISNHSTLLITLISCIILSTLQNFRDYQAYRLLRSANAMLKRLDDPDAAYDAELEGMNRDLVEREVRPLINRMEARRCVMCDQPAALMYSIQQSQPQIQSVCQLPVVPQAFTTLRSARDSLESILNWGHDHVPDFSCRANSKEIFGAILRDRIGQWQAALDHCQDPGTSHILLQIASLNRLILLCTVESRSETDFDVYNPVFQRIVDLVTCLPRPSYAHTYVSFGIDCGLIDIVALVGSRCHDPVIRRTALTWLLNTERFEGDRLSSDSGYIIRAWMTLEEGDGPISSAADIPECVRRRLVLGERYHAQRRLKLTFARSPYESSTGTNTDVIWLEDTNPANLKAIANTHGEEMPDVIFSPCHAAFLDDEKGTYHHIHTTKFYFPISKA
ncbi:uncharacterized protein LY89DRAFT_726501 [Mollisia scopiformis]|uniref:Uncharacterized protein n=1 Tax=Mollisia scopiformis TaxID=149040 RepID=A0A132B333_MOLSC|nr:uncharacterized protein LY89DRAFT_726501 [Mollisia scopiformis]KUJ06449.1 hypothetical protein LY89DRAFT_726501 [Mollisia scopiformis]